jgi:hypothetical protein
VPALWPSDTERLESKPRLFENWAKKRMASSVCKKITGRRKTNNQTDRQYSKILNKAFKVDFL